MKLTLEQFTKIKDQVEEELLGSGEDKYDAKSKFSEYAFEWDFHHTFPPTTSRLYFWWKDGEVHGKRTTSAMETSPYNYTEFTAFGTDYLKKVFKVE